MTWTATYFTHKEMACKCGKCNGLAPMDQKFMNMLDELRERYGKPLPVSSGFRCPKHPIEARKTKSGAHGTGKAADFPVTHDDAYRLLQIAFEMGFKGIGVNQTGDKRFIHLDMADADNFYRPTIWSY